jgi:hypothetical protein
VTRAAVALLFAAAVCAQQPEPSCCAEPDAPLPPLPATATAKERWLRQLHDDAAAGGNPFLSDALAAKWRAELAALPASAALPQRFGLQWSLAQALVRTGELDEAIGLLAQCERLCAEDPAAGDAWLPEVLFRLAAAHFRVAEKQNCIARHNEESCILPLSPRAAHADTTGALAAKAVLERLLALPRTRAGGDASLEREAAWLLNIAHMALGDWPAGVPEQHRVPPRVFASEAPFPRMRERGGELGFGRHSHSGGLAIDDVDGDGRLDVVTCSLDTSRALRLAAGASDGTFTDLAAAAGLRHQLGGSAVVTADVDGDGRLDLLVLRGGGIGAAFPCSLLCQDEQGRFADVTAEAGIELAAPARAAAFADVDRDGDLDLFVGYDSERAADGVRFPPKLWRNDGARRFTDVTAAAGIANPERCVGAVFGDVDGDDDADLYVSNALAPNRLFVNRGDGTFVEQAAARGVAEPIASGPCAFVDHDNDGDLDLFVTYQHHYRTIRSVAAWYVDRVVEDDCQRLYENDGGGRFRDVTEARGLRRVCVATGLAVGDVDNDGWPDLYVATGAHDMAALFPNVLLLGGARFRDATSAAGVGHLQKGNAAAFADLDADGDLDLAVQVGGFYPDDGFGDVVFENPGNGNHWLDVRLHGVRDNRFGVGARVRVRVRGGDGGDGAAERDVYTTVGPGGSTGGRPSRAHVGLGTATAIVFVEVRWPASGETERWAHVPLDRAIEVRQRDPAITVVDRPALRLGGAGR